MKGQTPETFIGWGAKQNISFKELVQRVQKLNLTTPEFKFYNNDGSLSSIPYEERYYPKYGKCYNLVNFTLTQDVVLFITLDTTEEKLKRAKVWVTDKMLSTRNGVYAQSHWGSGIQIEKGWFHEFALKVEQLSNFDPRQGYKDNY